VIGFDLDQGSDLERILGALDRAVSGRLRGSPFASVGTMWAGMMAGMMTATPRPGHLPPGYGQAAHPGAQARARGHQAPPPPRPRPAPAPPPPDPTIEARAILGFEPGEPLTVDKIKDRKRSLAKVFHPDTGAGSVKQMQRVLAAADLLIARI
jgi:hypothetical protein